MAKYRNKIDPFLMRMIAGINKWFIKRERSWSNRGVPTQIVAKLGLTIRKV